tara:strand:- start:290 stop:604 length:315 start_codon:yes stop_codon:yes gene_type:complete
MTTLRNEITAVKEMKNNFKTVSKIFRYQFQKESYISGVDSNGNSIYKTRKLKGLTLNGNFQSITKLKVEKYGLGELIGFRVWDVIENNEVVTYGRWVFENGEKR